MLMQNFGVRNKEHYGMLGYFLEWSMVVLKQLLKDKGIAFSSKAKKSELVQIFNTQAGNVTAYDGCFPKPQQFYFADKHPPKKNR